MQIATSLNTFIYIHEYMCELKVIKIVNLHQIISFKKIAKIVRTFIYQKSKVFK